MISPRRAIAILGQLEKKFADVDLIKKTIELCRHSIWYHEMRQTPQIYFKNAGVVDYSVCPRCERILPSENSVARHPFCPRCGQKLDWVDQAETAGDTSKNRGKYVNK